MEVTCRVVGIRHRWRSLVDEHPFAFILIWILFLFDFSWGRMAGARWRWRWSASGRLPWLSGEAPDRFRVRHGSPDRFNVASTKSKSHILLSHRHQGCRDSETRAGELTWDEKLKCRMPSGSLVPVHAPRTEYLWVIRALFEAIRPSHSGNERDTSDPVKASNQRGGIGTLRHRYHPGKGKPGRFDMCSWLQCICLQGNTWPSTPLYGGCLVHMHGCTCTCALSTHVRELLDFTIQPRGGRAQRQADGETGRQRRKE